MIGQILKVPFALSETTKTICNNDIDMSLLDKKVNKTYYGELEILNTEGD